MVNYCSMSENEGTSSASLSSNNHSRQQISYFVKESEIKNRPVKIVGATKGWLAMPSYAPSTFTTTNTTDFESDDDNDIARCCNQLPIQDDADDDVNNDNDNNNSTNINASSLSSSSSSWRDVGEESMLFQGGGKGGWT